MGNRGEQKGEEIKPQIQRVNGYNIQRNMSGIWKEVREIGNISKFNGITELYNEQEKVAIKTKGLKQVTNQHRQDNFHMRGDKRDGIFYAIKLIEKIYRQITTCVNL